MKLLIASLLVATTASAAPAKSPPKLFAKLFVEGASWTFKAEHVVSEPDEDGKLRKKTTKDTTTCTISGVQEIAGGWKASLQCDGLANPVSDTYVATTAGLWRVPSDWNGSTKSLKASEMLIRAPPKVERRESGNEQDGSESYIVKKHSGGWCFAHTHALGDEDGWMLCISESKGLIGGNSFTAGAFTDDVYFGVVPRW